MKRLILICLFLSVLSVLPHCEQCTLLSRLTNASRIWCIDSDERGTNLSILSSEKKLITFFKDDCGKTEVNGNRLSLTQSALIKRIPSILLELCDGICFDEEVSDYTQDIVIVGVHDAVSPEHVQLLMDCLAGIGFSKDNCIISNRIHFLQNSLKVSSIVLCVDIDAGCYAKNASDSYIQVGGLGHFFDAGGGQYSIGKYAIKAVLEQELCCGGETQLYSLIQPLFNIEGVAQLQQSITNRKLSPQMISQLSPYVFKLAR